MCSRRCPLSVTRRGFLAASSAALAAPTLGRASQQLLPLATPKGPGSRCRPIVRGCFVRRKGNYGMWWPGAVYDGEAARKRYLGLATATAEELGIQLDLTPTPLYSRQEAEAWLAKATEAKPDGLFVVLLDRQQHAWPTANKAIATGIPTVVFSPVGTSFTTNTSAPSRKQGCFIASTNDFNEARYGLKMLAAWVKLRATRCLVIRGSKETETTLKHLGITLHHIPARVFIEEYRKTEVNDQVEAMADYYLSHGRKVVGPSRQDVLNGAKSYLVASRLLERHEADAITMDCLGALGRTKISLPCLAWSRMNDEGIPAACEADIGAVATHCIVQYLFDRPGFQQDPVAETARQAIIGAHCTCATRLRGFDQPPEPFDIVHHHGMRDATTRTLWKPGQRVTSADVAFGRKGGKVSMLISAGTVLENVSVPPAGGCVVSVMVKFDGVEDVLAYPGFHQIFFYGDFKRRLVQFCRLVGIEPVVV